jgi:hypothetical protein
MAYICALLFTKTLIKNYEKGFIIVPHNAARFYLFMQFTETPQAPPPNVDKDSAELYHSKME